MAVHTQMEILLLSLTGHSVWSWHLTLDYIKHSLNVLSHEKLAYLVAQTVKNPPAMQETWVWFLSGQDPWRREWQPTPVFWPGEWTEDPGGLQSMGVKRVGHNWVTNISFFFSYIIYNDYIVSWSSFSPEYFYIWTTNIIWALFALLVYFNYGLSSVQSLSRVQLFATPWTAAHQASLSITNSQS